MYMMWTLYTSAIFCKLLLTPVWSWGYRLQHLKDMHALISRCGGSENIMCPVLKPLCSLCQSYMYHPLFDYEIVSFTLATYNV